MDPHFELKQFLEQNPHPDHTHYVLPGMVISGQVPLSKISSGTFGLTSVTVFAGSFSIVSVDDLVIPFDRVLAWGSGGINPVQAI